MDFASVTRWGRSCSSLSTSSTCAVSFASVADPSVNDEDFRWTRPHVMKRSAAQPIDSDNRNPNHICQRSLTGAVYFLHVANLDFSPPRTI